MDYWDRLIETSKKRSARFAAEWATYDLIHELIRIRLSRNLTQEQVADRMNLPRPRISDIERTPGRTTFRRLVAYASAINASLTATADTRGLIG